MKSLIKKTARKMQYIALGYLVLPVMASAQFTEGGTTGELNSFGRDLLGFINDILVPFMFAIALAMFIYGVFVFLIQAGGEEEAREKGRRFMFWGIIAFVLMVSVWGITNLIASGLGFSNTQDIGDKIPNANNINL